MEVRIKIPEPMVHALKWAGRRKSLVALGLTGTSMLVYAATVTKPFSFTSGQTISASQVNSNFDTLFSEVNAKETRITTLEGASWTKGTGGLYTSETKVGVGVTTPSTRFDVNGAVKVANDSSTCSTSLAGSIRWNGSQFQGCNGTSWVRLDYAPGNGASADQAGLNCKQILANYPTAASGVYYIDPDGGSTTNAFQAYCDMTSDGGGWTLVLLNSKYATPVKPTFSNVVNTVNVTGTFGTNLEAFDLFMGVKYWNLIGTQMRLMQGASPTNISHKATYTFSLDDTANYTLNMSNESVSVCTTGTCSPGMYTYHRGRALTTYDKDNDASSGNCSNSYSNTAWWYGACWDGSFWGGGDVGGYTNNPYWAGSGGEYFVWGSIWIR